MFSVKIDECYAYCSSNPIKTSGNSLEPVIKFDIEMTFPHFFQIEFDTDGII